MILVVLALIAWGGSIRAQSLEDGISAVEGGRLEEAARILSAVIREQPDSVQANFYLGLVHFRAGRAAAARPLLERAVSLSPAHAQAWKLLGLATTSGGNYESAVPALARACELDRNDEDACYYFARVLFTLGRYQAAREPFEKALSAARREILPKIHRAAAMNFAALGLPAETERHFVKAVQLNGRTARKDEDPRVDYGAFLFRQGRIEEALRPLEQAARDAPSSARANVELGRVLLHLGKPDAAAECLAKAVALEPGDWNARLLLGRAYLRLGKADEGEREMRLGQEGWASKHEKATAPQ